MNDDDLKRIVIASQAVARKAEKQGFSLRDPSKATYIKMLFQDALDASNPARTSQPLPESESGDKPQE